MWSTCKIDAFLTMPPVPTWYAGREAIVSFAAHKPCGGAGRLRLLPVRANGAPAFAQYKPDPEGGFSAWSLQVLDVDPGGQRLRGVVFFLDVASYYPMFGLPLHLDA